MADDIPSTEFQSRLQRSGSKMSLMITTIHGLHGKDAVTEVGDHLGLLPVDLVVAEPGNQGDSVKGGGSLSGHAGINKLAHLAYIMP